MLFARAVAVVAALAAIAAPVAAALAFNDYFKPPDGSQGKPYDFRFQARAGCDPVYYYSMLRGSLPPGLALSQSGRISGTPTTPGVYQFTAQLESYYNGCTSYPSQRDFTIGISPTKVAIVGVPYSVRFGSSGDAKQTWSIAAGQLPPGLTFTSGGTLSGTPTTSGSYAWSVRLGDAPDAHQVTIEVEGKLAPVPAPSKSREVGVRMSVELAVSGGTGPYTWAQTGGALPPGVILAGHTISGVPRAGGSFRGQFTVTVPLAVKARLALERLHLAPARANRPYRARLQAAGGLGPFVWKVTGKLPIGIRLDRRSGILSGVTQLAGRFPLTFTVMDALGRASKASVVLTVR
jgi:large repetitive protein